MNTVTIERVDEETVPVESLPGGTFVTWTGSERVFIVVRYKSNTSDLAAIALDNGGFLNPGTLVTKLPEGTKIEVTVDAFGS